MPIFRTKSRVEVARFVANLRERGYRRVPAKVIGGSVPFMSFSLTRKRVSHPRADGSRPLSLYYHVTYHERAGGPIKRPPVSTVPLYLPQPEACTVSPAHGRAKTHGLCRRCYMRWLYWHNEEFRERTRARMIAYRAAKKAAREKRAA